MQSSTINKGYTVFDPRVIENSKDNELEYCIEEMMEEIPEMANIVRQGLADG